MSSLHIEAQKGDFAETVLMPGDPLRAKYIAEKFLDNPVCINQVRGMLGYTGSYKGRRVSVMGHGMGIPSCSIYVTELYKEYDVENIIRVGTCGAVRDDVKLRDVIVAMGASTDSKVNRLRFKDHDFSAIADWGLLKKVSDTADRLNKKIKIGNIFSADIFYTPQPDMFSVMEKMGILAVEMEAAGIYGIAAEYGKKALTILTVSDHIKTGEKTTASEREKTFDDMQILALESL